ncbi:hypothetical protein BJY52DRAFT_1227582 [Lactarius psammicola]|nr:hypothetical protein BJY52DRAFT_1227582 [Lactarius psammicola]
MQGDHLESQGASELEVNRFKEAVCALNFWKGVLFLNESDSNAGQHQGEMAGPSNPSADNNSFSEVPKNVELLQHVFQKLIDKDPPKGISPEWLSKARYGANFLKKWESIRKTELEDFLSDLENEKVLVDVLAGGDGEL